MAGQDDSSEELVEDDSGEEEYQQEGESSASFDSEEDEDDGLTGGDDAADVFETPQKARKRRRVAPTPDPGQKTTRRTPTPTPTPPAATKPKPNTNANSSKKKNGGNAALKKNSEKEAGGKGKGKVPTKPPEASSSSLSTASSGDGLKPSPGEVVQTPPPPPATASTDGGSGSGGVSGSGRVPVSSSTPSHSPGTTATAATPGSKSHNPEKAGPAVAKTPKAAVSDYMLQSNRPYSCINVFDNLRKKIPKPMVQKLLDELTRSGTLKMQEYGKAKVYYANQAALPNGAGDVSEEKMARLEKDAKEFTSKLEAASAQAREAQAKANSLSGQPSDASLDEKLASTALDLERMEARNASAKGEGRGNVAGSMKAAKASANKFRALWLARKRNAMDVVDMICDGMEKKPKVVMDMIGLEPDEDGIPPKM